MCLELVYAPPGSGFEIVGKRTARESQETQLHLFRQLLELGSITSEGVHTQIPGICGNIGCKSCERCC